MDTSSIKEGLEHTQLAELLASSSAETQAPVAFTGDNGTRTARRGSTASVTRSLEAIRNSLQGLQTPEIADQANYTTKEIFGDLDDSDIELQRLATRKTILSELATKAVENTDFDGFNEPALPIDNDGEEFGKIDPELITWNGFDDPEDPRNWALLRKAYVILFASIYSLIAPISSSILSPALLDLSQEFGIKSPVVTSMIISIQVLAWAFGPLVIAPLSEEDRFGRKRILDFTVWMSFIFNLGCAFSKNTSQMLILRFVLGLFSTTPINVAPAVVSDLFDAKSRNVSLAGVLLLPLLGPVLAPVMGGYIVENKPWRWVLYVLCIFNGVMAVAGTFFYLETYAPALLKRKAHKLRKATGNYNLHTIYEISNGESTLSKMKVTVSRPVKLLFTHPMVIGLGAFLAFIYGFLYLMIVTFPTIFSETYGFSKGAVGLMYLPLGVGFASGVFFWTYVLGKVYNRLTENNGGVPKPEFRLPCLFATSVIIPLGLLWYGWSVEKKLPWIMPGIGSAIFSFGFVCVFQTLLAYLIDMNPRFAASSMAALALFRSLFGFAFPLFALKMYGTMGYGWGNTMCAMIALLLGVPFPIVCYKYGERIRLWANARMDADQARRDEKNLQKLQQQRIRKFG